MKKFLVSIFAIICVLCSAVTAGGGVLAWANTEDTSTTPPIEIDTTEKFINTFSSSEFANDDVKIVLAEDLDFEEVSDEEMAEMFQTERVFQGEFDGDGHTISNITLSGGETSNNIGLFANANGAVIKNLKISGSVTFDFGENVSQTINAGVLVGRGQNVQIDNCELDNIKIITSEDESQTIEHQTLTIPVSSNINFGGLIGLATSAISDTQTRTTVISNCVSYYSINLNLQQNCLVYAGGLIGNLESGSIIKNSLYFGDITLTNSITGTSGTNTQYIGGIVGNLGGSTIVNTAFAGNIEPGDTSLDVCIGAIAGRSVGAGSLSYSYWTVGGIVACGQGNIEQNDHLKQVEQIDESFLKNAENFDIIELTFNFDTIWCLRDSRICLQRFLNFDYMFSGTNNYLTSQVFVTNDEETGESHKNLKYGKSLTIKLRFNEQFYNYYSLGSVILQGSTLARSNYTAQEVLDDDSGALIGYDIALTVNDMTDGAYDFVMAPVRFVCQVRVSDEAMENDQGGVSVGSSYLDQLPLTFTYQTRAQQISARGEGIYTFSHWELYYRSEADTEGQYSELVPHFDDARSSNLSINFGESPFNREFMLVAYFSSENAIQIDVSNFDSEGIKSVTINNELYEGTPIVVSHTDSNVSLVLVTNPNYLLNEEMFLSSIASLYGVAVEDLGVVSVSDPYTDPQTQETTYRFRLNMNSAVNVQDRSISLSFVVEEDNSSRQNGLLFVYIFVPLGVALIALVVVLIVLKKRKGGGPKQTKQKVKEESYKDYY